LPIQQQAIFEDIQIIQIRCYCLIHNRETWVLNGESARLESLGWARRSAGQAGRLFYPQAKNVAAISLGGTNAE
jgi:hypothetical protein